MCYFWENLYIVILYFCWFWVENHIKIDGFCNFLNFSYTPQYEFDEVVCIEECDVKYIYIYRIVGILFPPKNDWCCVILEMTLRELKNHAAWFWKSWCVIFCVLLLRFKNVGTTLTISVFRELKFSAQWLCFCPATSVSWGPKGRRKGKVPLRSFLTWTTLLWWRNTTKVILVLSGWGRGRKERAKGEEKNEGRVKRRARKGRREERKKGEEKSEGRGRKERGKGEEKSKGRVKRRAREGAGKSEKRMKRRERKGRREEREKATEKNEEMVKEKTVMQKLLKFVSFLP